MFAWVLLGLVVGVALAYAVFRLADWLNWKTLVAWVGLTSFLVVPTAVLSALISVRLSKMNLDDPESSVEFIEQTPGIPKDETLAFWAVCYLAFLLALGVLNLSSDKAREKGAKSKGQVKDK